MQALIIYVSYLEIICWIAHSSKRKRKTICVMHNIVLVIRVLLLHRVHPSVSQPSTNYLESLTYDNNPCEYYKKDIICRGNQKNSNSKRGKNVEKHWCVHDLGGSLFLHRTFIVHYKIVSDDSNNYNKNDMTR